MHAWVWVGLLATSAAAAPLLEMELRWVDQVLPVRSGALTSSAGVPAGAGVLRSGRAAGGAEERLGPVMRVQSGGSAQWQLSTAQSLLLARVATQGLRADLPLHAPPQVWRLEATPTGPNAKGQFELRLSWQQPDTEGVQQSWQTSLPVRAGRWTVVARTVAPNPPEPGTLRSQAAHALRELQVRVTPVLSAAE